MSETQAFSTAAEDAITRTSNVVPEKTPAVNSEEFLAYYEIDRTSRLIKEGDYKRVCSWN